MAYLGDYTTTEAVRGCLGIDVDDCPDRYMVDSKVELELQLDLDTWLASHAALYSTGTQGTPTALQKAVAQRIELYAQWFIALEFTNRPLTIPQITTVGKSQIDRFKVDLSRLTQLAAAKVAKYKGELQAAVEGKPATAAYANFVSVAVPGADPVTEVIQ